MSAITQKSISTIPIKKNNFNISVAIINRALLPHPTISDKDIEVLNVFIQNIKYRNIVLFIDCTIKNTGINFEVADVTFDHEIEPDDKPFKGVKITEFFDDESIILSKKSYRYLALIIANIALDVLENNITEPGTITETDLLVLKEKIKNKLPL